MFFLACDIKTGRVQAELPMSIDSLTRALMTVSTATLTLAVTDPRCPRDWMGLIAPWQSVIIAVSHDGRIWWAGIPQEITREAHSPVVEVHAATLESYLGRRYVPPRRFNQADQTSEIAHWLVETTIDAGIPMGLDTPASGVLRDREYTIDEAGTVLQRLTDLAGVINGPEWWIDTTWAEETSQSGIRHIFRTGYPRVGVASTHPQAVFEMPGGLLGAKVEDRWGEGEAATYVQLSGEGEGETKPLSSPHVALTREWGGFPRLELHESAQNVTDVKTLEAKAEQRLTRLANGTRVITLEQKFDATPRLGTDWNIGDDVRVIVNTQTLNLDTVLRLVGWKINEHLTTVSPIVAQMNDETAHTPTREE